jgi:PKD repeat protein
VANAGGPYTGTVYVPVSFSGAGSSDPQGQALTYAWNFGDSTTGTGVNPTHTYSVAQSYTVSLTVTDTSNLTGTANTIVTITPPPPIAKAGGPYIGRVGTAVNFSGAASSDSQDETLTYTWNFGDGTTGTGVNPTHTYTAAGKYTVSLTVTDTSNLTGTTTTTATIATVGPSDVNGVVYDGQQPISGAHVYLLAANTTGYGQSSISLLNASATGLSDSVGAYVLTAADGGFIWTGDYSCSPGTQVYVYARGGTTSTGTNSASGLMAALGTCPNTGDFSAVPYIWVNEVSTMATAYALAGFATDVTHVSSSGTSLAQIGVANAFANAANLETLSSGFALNTTPAGNGIVPQAEIYTLANILSACIDSNGPSSNSCSTLFSNAMSNGSSGITPSDTATAAINIAHNPGANITALYTIPINSPPFSPSLTAQPNDFTIALQFSGGGLMYPYGLAIDGDGNVWVANECFCGITKFSSTGIAISPPSGYTGGGLGSVSAPYIGGEAIPYFIAIDTSGNVWTEESVSTLYAGTMSFFSEFSGNGVALSPSSGYFGMAYNGIMGGGFNGFYMVIDGLSDIWNTYSYTGTISEFSPSGTTLILSGNYSGGGLDEPNGVAVDGYENVWAVNVQSNSLTKLSNSGVVISPGSGFTGGGLAGPRGIAIDAAGNVWATNIYQSPSAISKFSNSGVAISPSSGYTGGGLSLPDQIAIDGAGNVWVVNDGPSSAISEFSNAGVALSPSTGFIGAGKGQIAVDGSGNVWVTSGYAVTEFIGAGTPVVTPLAVGVKNNTLGTRP